MSDVPVLTEDEWWYPDDYYLSDEGEKDERDEEESE